MAQGILEELKTKLGRYLNNGNYVVVTVGIIIIIIAIALVFINKKKSTMLLSRLDLPPTSLRILGAAKLIEVLKNPPKLYKYRLKSGNVQNPKHSQGIVCSGLAQSFEGAKKLIGRELEPPFTKIIGTFGTKGLVIVGIETKDQNINKGEPVVLKELRSFTLKTKKDLNL